MIIWLNGAFGAGKTQTAYELRRRLEGSYVYDPENAGFFIRQNLPASLRTGDFQDYPMWRSCNLEMLSYLAERHDGPIIVPMTITDRAYYDELVGALARRFEVRHIILYAEEATLRKRLASRLEGPDSWAAQQIGRCLRAFQEDITEVRLPTDGLSISQTVRRAADLAGVALSEDRRGAVRRACDRFLIQCGHIR